MKEFSQQEIDQMEQYLTSMPEEGYRTHIDRNDCVVRAFANLTGASYMEAFKTCRASGRRDGCGMRVRTWLPLIRSALSVRRKKLTPRDDLRNDYRTPITLSRALARRGGTYMVLFRSHVAVFRDGEWLDWMQKNRRYRVIGVWKLEETEE